MSDPVHPKIARTDHAILDVIRMRWSPRAFDPEKDVGVGDLAALFEAARWAPSSMNEQPWRFVVAARSRSHGAFEALLGSITPRNRTWAGAVPVLVLVAVRETLEQNDAVNAHAWYDTGQAVGFLTLQATALGLSLRQMEGFDHEAARSVCKVPAPFEPAVVIAVGYAGDPAALAIDAHRAAERRPRIRRVVAESVFDGEWGRALLGPDERANAEPA